mgnify:CR=1 FL=1
MTPEFIHDALAFSVVFLVVVGCMVIPFDQIFRDIFGDK